MFIISLGQSEQDVVDGYRGQICEHTRKKVELALARALVEWSARIYARALYKSVDEQR